MDISICFADFPTEAIGQTTRDFRQLGIGYANLGALLMATGHAYDSEGGRAIAAAITSLMTGTAYRRSAELAGDRRSVRRLRAQRRAAHAGHAQARGGQRRSAYRSTSSTRAILDAATERVGRGPARSARRNGWRNAQATRARPDRHHRLHDGLRHHRHRAGPGAGQVQEAGRRRLDADRQPDRAARAAAPRLPAGADRGDRRATSPSTATWSTPRGCGRSTTRCSTARWASASIAPMGHVRMMAAVQPFISGAISQDGEPAGVGDRRGHRGDLLPGLEAGPQGAGRSTATTARSASRCRTPRAQEGAAAKAAPLQSGRRSPPGRRRPTVRPPGPQAAAARRAPGSTTSFSVGGAEGYMTAELLPGRRPRRGLPEDGEAGLDPGAA